MNLKKIAGRFLKFANVGIFVTITSLLLSFFFLKVVGTPLIPTYIILYLTMIGFSYILNSRYTFKAKSNLRRMVLYYMSYGISMLLGISLLFLFRKTLPFENWILAYLVIPFTLSSNFILSSLIFKNLNGKR